jgi:hypothetical protein
MIWIIKSPPDADGHIWYLVSSTRSQTAWSADAAQARQFKTKQEAEFIYDIQQKKGNACYIVKNS